MIYKEVCLERRGQWQKKTLRPVRWYDWFPVVRRWLYLVWRPVVGAGRISARTAWKAAKSLSGIVSDPTDWNKIQQAMSVPEEVVMQEEATLREQLEKSVLNAEKIAGVKAGDILEAAARRAEKLRSLPDEALQRIVMKYIDSILPRGSS